MHFLQIYFLESYNEKKSLLALALLGAFGFCFLLNRPSHYYGRIDTGLVYPQESG